jgi:hypothetical protein
MLGRRKHPRYVLSETVVGSLQLRDEVSIERWGEREVVVLSPEPVKPEERLTLEVPGQSRHRVHVRVLESRPALTDGNVIRHRLRLAIEGQTGHVTQDGAEEP